MAVAVEVVRAADGPDRLGAVLDWDEEGLARRSGPDDTLVGRGCNPGCKLSATHSNSEHRAALYSTESHPTEPDRSGWGPGGRRFKSCLPDSTKALLTRGFCRSRRAEMAIGVQTGCNFCAPALQGPWPDSTAPAGSTSSGAPTTGAGGRSMGATSTAGSARSGARRAGGALAARGRSPATAPDRGGGRSPHAGLRSARGPSMRPSRRSGTGLSSRARGSRTARTASRCSASTSRRRSASGASSRKRQDVERLARAMLAERRGAQDGPQRDDVPALRLRARDRQRLGGVESGGPCRAAEAPARGRRRPGPAVPHARRTRRGDRDDPGPRRRSRHARSGVAARDPRGCRDRPSAVGAARPALEGR